ncbi:hypothetical protein A3F08_00165 [Candidatus Berkelbacteria bacterium RIFCSPHIGHO2_12_FULL_36_9]|uniref:Antitoxin n=1 Tax=Candidatus Berkelbacteria bacterium RIFCSPHIGHO2_12_FULL_36_9 TaxID=1797469 RepID=A0A1F5EHS3_9BACT|nr:MAG: hypothetical protein A3F08_00165 [Candidatus Berkelbacteria bacterium RIFCSPHIGHO2_12_FULL_36_9]
MNRIEINPKKMVGKPIIKGTRIPVYLVVNLLAQGLTFDEIIEDYPRLTKKDIIAALQYAGNILSSEGFFPLFDSKIGRYEILSR